VIPDQLVEGHGYPPLTDELKAKVSVSTRRGSGTSRPTASAPPLDANAALSLSESMAAGGRRRPPALGRGGREPTYEYACTPCLVVSRPSTA